MLHLTVDQIRALMDKATNIRHVAVIGEGEQGKTTLTEVLDSHGAFIITEQKGIPCMYGQHKEAAESIRVKSLASTLYFESTEEDLKDIPEKTEGTSFLINLIDCPGHVDFSSEVTTALRVTDGALIVVDCRRGIYSQTESILRQALSELVKPILVINKVDCVLLELQVTKEDLYQSFARTIESVNCTITAFNDEKNLGDAKLFPEKGSVAFGSCLHGWAFTIRQFASRYSIKFGVDQDKMAEKLWGDHFFVPTTKKWSRKSHDEDGKPRERAFNLFVLDPIFKLFDTIMNGKKDIAFNMLDRLNITLNQDEKDMEGKPLLKLVMRRFLPASEALLGMTVLHLPSPVTAQKYRVGGLYEGPQNDECADGIRGCDPNGPLMLYVSKMMLSTDKGGRFYAFGRVFSGTVRAGLKVRIQAPDYTPGTKYGLYIKSIPRIVMMLGSNVKPIAECPAGNFVGLVGVDQFLFKSGTITTSDSAYNFRMMKFSVVPVVQIAVEPKDPADLPKLVEALRRLSVAVPGVDYFMDEDGRNVIAGSSEHHLELCLRDLQKEHAPEIPVKSIGPWIQYRETCQAESSMTVLAKSPNKHNRVFMRAVPLSENFTIAIEKGIFDTRDNWKARARVLSNDYGWSDQEAKKIWAFGPETVGPNLLVDMAESVTYLNEIRDACTFAFRWATKEGPLMEENMRGIRFNIMDVVLTADAVHRGAGQMIPAFRRAICASMMTAQPSLMEPIYAVEITCSEEVLEGVYRVLNTRRGHVVSEEQRLSGITSCSSFSNSASSSSSSSSLHLLKAFLPVEESFGFLSDLCQATKGQAVAQLIFDHWETLSGDCSLDSWLKERILEVRKRKGLKEEIPTLNWFIEVVNKQGV
ncbi:Elongation factor 2 [Gryganskiella cystojenkinii]|nr:Elongation factor 2 [Gryganskiella cystojenkinii]